MTLSDRNRTSLHLGPLVPEARGLCFVVELPCGARAPVNERIDLKCSLWCPGSRNATGSGPSWDDVKLTLAGG